VIALGRSRWAIAPNGRQHPRPSGAVRLALSRRLQHGGATTAKLRALRGRASQPPVGRSGLGHVTVARASSLHHVHGGAEVQSSVRGAEAVGAWRGSVQDLEEVGSASADADVIPATTLRVRGSPPGGRPAGLSTGAPSRRPRSSKSWRSCASASATATGSCIGSFLPLANTHTLRGPDSVSEASAPDSCPWLPCMPAAFRDSERSAHIMRSAPVRIRPDDGSPCCSTSPSASATTGPRWRRGICGGGHAEDGVT
jgi:hypothetical protein